MNNPSFVDQSGEFGGEFPNFANFTQPLNDTQTKSTPAGDFDDPFRASPKSSKKSKEKKSKGKEKKSKDKEKKKKDKKKSSTQRPLTGGDEVWRDHGMGRIGDDGGGPTPQTSTDESRNVRRAARVEQVPTFPSEMELKRLAAESTTSSWNRLHASEQVPTFPIEMELKRSAGESTTPFCNGFRASDQATTFPSDMEVKLAAAESTTHSWNGHRSGDHKTNGFLDGDAQLHLTSNSRGYAHRQESSGATRSTAQTHADQPTVAYNRSMFDQSSVLEDGSISVFTNDDLSRSAVQELAEGGGNEVSYDLLVGYMMSMGADRASAEQVAASFAAEQNKKATSEFAQRPVRIVPPASATIRKAAEIEQYGNQGRYGPENFGAIHSGVSTEQSLQEGVCDAAVVEARPVKEGESELPTVYAESTPVGIKHLLKERPIRRLVCVALIIFLAGIVSLILFLTVFKTTEMPPATNAPTSTPSQSPTFLSDDLVAAASLLSRPENLEDPSSPQFRAVGWLSSFDTIDTSGLGLAFAQRYALVVMYFSLLGEDWTNQEKWLDPSLHECDWSSGIFCQYDVSEQRVVTGFDATRNNLQGSIPDEIGWLTSSETFRIPKNKVGGTLPSTIGSMTSLSVIDCSENEIEGSIPSTINGASNLIQLDLSSNKLNSTIPNELYSLKLLRTLAVRSNRLSGPLNETIAGLQSLVTLDVRNNSLSGPLPLSFDGFPALDIVWLDYNQFTGMLPNITNAFTRKQTLSLSHNKFIGNAQLSPDFNFTSLLAGEDNRVQHIDISYNQLRGPISNTFFYLPNLKYFDLSGNFFTGTFRSDIAWLGIEHLAASNNELTGTIPTGYETLTHLDMSHNQFTQGIPLEICQYPNLQFLILSGNSINSALPSCLGSIPKLRDLEVSDSRLSGAIPTIFGQLDMLEVLNLSGNDLTGSIPLEVGTMVALKDLYLEQNKLTGTIPSELSNLTSLRNLDLSDNSMTGSIPAWSGTFTDLESIVLVGNAFLGEIPSALCAATNLELTFRDVGCSIDCSCCGDSDVCVR